MGSSLFIFQYFGIFKERTGMFIKHTKCCDSDDTILQYEKWNDISVFFPIQLNRKSKMEILNSA